MDWVLILTLWFWGGGRSVATLQIDNFRSQEACKIAGDRWKEQHPDSKVEMNKYVCVPRCRWVNSGRCEYPQ